MQLIKLLSLLAVFFLYSCQDVKTELNDKLKITTTTTILKNLIEEIGGDKVEVISLMGVGVDPHLYKATAGDLYRINNAELIIFAGLHLEGKLSAIFDNLSNKQPILNASKDIDENFMIMHDNLPDPHIWFDTSLYLIEAQTIANKLIEIDNKNQLYYKENFEKYKKAILELEDYIFSRIAELPPEKRILVTAHDAFSYFGRKFKLTIKAIQGISTESEASIQDIQELADFISQTDIKAIFLESATPKRTVLALQEAVKAQNKSVIIGDELFADSLGDEQSNTNTYINTFRFNIDTIVEALK